MLVVVLAGLVDLTDEQRTELRALTNSPGVAATVATRARIVLWRNEGRQKKDIAVLAGVSRPTVDVWLGRYTAEGVAGLADRSHAAPREQVPARIRARVLALTRMLPGAEDADDGVVVDADVVRHERLAGGGSARRSWVGCRRSSARCRLVSRPPR